MKIPFIIAEIAQGYEGKEKQTIELLEAACSSGADAVKFQIFYADELALSDYKYHKLFKSLELPFGVWEQAVKYAHQQGLEFYSDIFGVESFKELQNIAIDGFKIHTTDINNINLLKEVASSRKKVFLSTGGCSQDEVGQALKILDSCEVILMYGFQAEPTDICDNNLNRIATIRSIFERPVGFQDHTTGDSQLALYLPFIALGLGATVFEKHLTLSRELKLEDYISALEPDEFKSWAENLREAYSACGIKQWKLNPKEVEYRNKVKRAVCSLRDIKEQELIGMSDLVLKRTDNSEAIFEISEVLGKKCAKAINKNSVIKKGDIL